MSLRQAIPRPLNAGAIVAACVTAGTSFAREPLTDRSAWLDQLEIVNDHHLSNVALNLLGASEPGEDAGWPEVVSKLRVRARGDAMATLAAEGTCGAALRSLGQHHIPFIVIKGPASARFHPDPMKRTYSDVDILVPPRQFGAAIDVLLDLGYVRNRDAEPLWPIFDQLCVEGFNFHRTPIGNIDLHHHVSPWRFGKNLNFETLFRRSDSFEIAGQTVQVASAEDSLLISCLHVINDLGKDAPSFNSWRDIAILFDQLGTSNLDRIFQAAGLGWFEPYVLAGLADLGAVTDSGNAMTNHVIGGLLDRGERLRLGLMGWNEPSLLARHPIGWVLRLPTFRAMLFFVGSAVPSPRYVRQRYANYRSYWRAAASSLFIAMRGADFRHLRISSVSVRRRSVGGDQISPPK